MHLPSRTRNHPWRVTRCRVWNATCLACSAFACEDCWLDWHTTTRSLNLAKSCRITSITRTDVVVIKRIVSHEKQSCGYRRRAWLAKHNTDWKRQGRSRASHVQQRHRHVVKESAAVIQYSRAIASVILKFL